MKHFNLNNLAMILILLLSAGFLTDFGIYAQPVPPPDGDEEMMMPHPGLNEGKGNARNRRKNAKNALENFSWSSAEQTVMPLIKKENPALYQFIAANKDGKTKLSKRLIHGIAILVNVKEVQPDKFTEIYNIHTTELDIERLSAAYQQENNSTKKNELRNQIKTKLTYVFEQKEKVRLEIISRLEENLNRQKNEYQQRQERKGRIIDKRLKRLLEDSDDLDW